MVASFAAVVAFLGAWETSRMSIVMCHPLSYRGIPPALPEQLTILCSTRPSPKFAAQLKSIETWILVVATRGPDPQQAIVSELAGIIMMIMHSPDGEIFQGFNKIDLNFKGPPRPEKIQGSNQRSQI